MPPTNTPNCRCCPDLPAELESLQMFTERSHDNSETGSQITEMAQKRKGLEWKPFSLPVSAGFLFVFPACWVFCYRLWMARRSPNSKLFLNKQAMDLLNIYMLENSRSSFFSFPPVINLLSKHRLRRNTAITQQPYSPISGKQNDFHFS